MVASSGAKLFKLTLILQGGCSSGAKMKEDVS